MYFFATISLCDVAKDIDVLESSATPKLSSRLLKDVFEVLSDELCYMLIMSVTTGRYPDVCRMVNYGEAERMLYANIMDTYDIENLSNRRKEHLLMQMYMHKDNLEYVECVRQNMTL